MPDVIARRIALDAIILTRHELGWNATMAAIRDRIDKPSYTVDLSAARRGGVDWEAWAPVALASEDGVFFRGGYEEPGVTDEYLDDRVIDRMAAFCQTCMMPHVPGRGIVAWWFSGRPSACLECVPLSERGEVSFTS